MKRQTLDLSLGGGVGLNLSIINDPLNYCFFSPLDYKKTLVSLVKVSRPGGLSAKQNTTPIAFHKCDFHDKGWNTVESRVKRRTDQLLN